MRRFVASHHQQVASQHQDDEHGQRDAFADTDPTFNNTFWPLHDNAIQIAAGRVGNQMSVNQKVPFPDKLKTKNSSNYHDQ
ncbi:hypothetical protein [Stieleria marina]|uniref:Uncharacterized protein n=1 Tax=Stieleria marina TaxID=1930275 RepID=A0A517P236_9BACT|nr:hypothetical protein K239x_54360 [Planctomycetes bacterium K23_9]